MVEFPGMNVLTLFIFFFDILIKILNFAVFARILFSWLPQTNYQHSRIYQFLHDITEPLFRLVRFLPHTIGMIDISPLYVIFLLQILQTLVAYISASFIS